MEEGTAAGLAIVMALIVTGTASYYYFIYAPGNQIECKAGQTVGCTISSTSFSTSFSISVVASSTCSTSTTTSGSTTFTTINCSTVTTSTKAPYCVPYTSWCFDILPTLFSGVGAASLALVVFSSPRKDEKK